jgi:hypothetical protein
VADEKKAGRRGSSNNKVYTKGVIMAKKKFGSGEQAKVGLDEDSKRMRRLSKSSKKWKSDAERIKKGEEMSKLYGGWLGKEMPGTKKKKSSRHAPATGKQAVEEFYERVDRAKDRGEVVAKGWNRSKGHKEWRKKAINRHKGNK